MREISFQYSSNMCIIQIGELVGRLSDEFLMIEIKKRVLRIMKVFSVLETLSFCTKNT